MENTPSIGRIVHYRLASGRTQGEIRPAIITRVYEDGEVDLSVIIGPGDPYHIPLFGLKVTEGDGNDQYHWPERV